jgi:sulfur-oxidizing protein SoxZ
MSEPMKIRAFLVKDVVEMKLMVKHPMESGLRKDEEGKRIPAHYIETLVVKCSDRVVLDAHLGMAVSENPYIAFNFHGAKKGDPISVSWIDNRGDTRTDQGVVDG